MIRFQRQPEFERPLQSARKKAVECFALAQKYLRGHPDQPVADLDGGKLDKIIPCVENLRLSRFRGFLHHSQPAYRGTLLRDRPVCRSLTREKRNMYRTTNVLQVAVAVTLLGSVAIAQNQQKAPPPPMTFFVTSTPVGNGANLGGLAG